MNTNPNQSEMWHDAIKKFLASEVATIVDEEALAAMDRVRARVTEKKTELINRVVEKIRVTQNHSDMTLRFQIIIEL